MIELGRGVADISYRPWGSTPHGLMLRALALRRAQGVLSPPKHVLSLSKHALSIGSRLRRK